MPVIVYSVLSFFFKRRKIKKYTYMLLCVIHMDHLWQGEQGTENRLPLGRDIWLEDRGRREIVHIPFVPFEFYAI